MPIYRNESFPRANFRVYTHELIPKAFLSFLRQICTGPERLLVIIKPSYEHPT